MKEHEPYESIDYKKHEEEVKNERKNTCRNGLK